MATRTLSLRLSGYLSMLASKAGDGAYCFLESQTLFFGNIVLPFLLMDVSGTRARSMGGGLPAIRITRIKSWKGTKIEIVMFRRFYDFAAGVSCVSGSMI